MKLKFKSIQKMLFVGIFIFSLFLNPICAEAKTTRTYVYNEYAEEVNAPNAYICQKVLNGRELGIGSFLNITDIYVNGYIYVSDAGNHRIVVLDSDYQVVKTIDKVYEGGEESLLNAPAGTFLFKDLLYICDMGNARVIAIDDAGNIVKKYMKPESDLLPEDFQFKPSKVVVNSAGSVYVAASGVYQGLLHYEEDGTFIEFFGANKVEVTPAVVIKSMWMNIFSEEQRESLVRTVPTEYAGIFIDDEDMVYTTTRTAQTSQVKRLNASGENILVFPGASGSLLQKGYDRNNFGDQKTDAVKGDVKYSEIIDVEVDEDGVIAVLDAQRSRVFLYSSEQDLLTIFGGSGKQKGYFTTVSAIGKCGEDYLVSDMAQNTITVFSPTAYMQDIRHALQEYNAGNYGESREYWFKVFEENAGLAVAAKSIGRTMLLEGNYAESMEYLKMGDDRYYYSMAFTHYRRQFLRENGLWLILCVAGGVVGIWFGIRSIYKAIIESGNNTRRKRK